MTNGAECLAVYSFLCLDDAPVLVRRGDVIITSTVDTAPSATKVR